MLVELRRVLACVLIGTAAVACGSEDPSSENGGAGTDTGGRAELPDFNSGLDAGAGQDDELMTWLSRARQMVNAGRMVPAVQALNRAVQVAPEAIAPRVLRARLHHSQGNVFDPKVAEADYRFVLQREPENLDALSGLAGLMAEHGSLEEAQQLLPKVEQALPAAGRPDLQAEFDVAQIHTSLRSGKHAQAVAATDAILAQADSPRVRYLRAMALEGLGELERAEADAAHLVKNRPDQSQARHLRSRLLNLLGRTDEARQEADVAGLLDRLAETADDADARVPVLEQLAEKAPEHARVWSVHLARAHLERKDGAAAESALQPLVTAEPAHAEALFLLAQAQALQGRGDDARATARKLRDLGVLNAAAIDDLLRRIESALGS